MNTMGNEELKMRMMASIDGELGPEEEAELQSRIQSDAQLMEEFQQLKNLKTMTTQHQLKKPPQEFWEDFSVNTFTRIERGIGWILLTLGALILGGYGGWLALKEIFTDPGIELWVKAAAGMLGSGILILVVSLIRERLYVNRNERYKGIKQ